MMTAAELATFTTGAAIIDRSDRVRLSIAGPDRAKFLHNLTTNEIKRLPPGRGCETFVTSTQGKTIGYLIVLIADDTIIARADSGGAELVLPHFQKYGVFDDVSIDDESDSTFEIHVFGAGAPEVVRQAAGRLPDDVDYAHCRAEIAGAGVRIVRESPTGLAGFTLIGERAAAAAIHRKLADAAVGGELAEIDGPIFEVLRVEAGTPVFGKDINDKNLPQELGRDDRAISFVKGCYLGQETVARIDALGHVNQVMKGFEFEPGAAVPPAGSALEFQGKRVGTITSAVFFERTRRGRRPGPGQSHACRAGNRVGCRRRGRRHERHRDGS